nr:MAG TPA: hypothetical protein [Caudoviricetes sp.]
MNNRDRAAIAAYLVDKLGKLDKLTGEDVTISAYVTGRSVGVTVMWPDDEEEDDGGWVQC